MTQHVVCDIAVSADGFVAGPNQSEEHPLGEGPAERLHSWMFDTPDENAAEVARITDAGAFVMGRNVFGPIRGAWSRDWRGWWGEEPPYHAPVFVLTNHAREPAEMSGGTTFNFVTEGIEAALERAGSAAGERNVAIAGGAATVNQYLAAGLLDELRVHVAPLLLGSGARLFEGLPAGELELVSSRSASLVTHVTYRPKR